MTLDLDLKTYLGIIRKRLWLMVTIVLVCCTATGIFSYVFIKPVYEASTKILVNSPLDRPGLPNLDLNIINTNISLINTYREIIKTPAIMGIVAEQHPEFELSQEQLMKKIIFSSVSDTQVITLAIQDLSYEKAARIVNSVSEVFQQQIPLIMKVDNVYLLHQADPLKVPNPVKPNPLLNIAVSFIASLLLSLGIILLLEFLDDRIKSEEDVEHYLSLPTLAVIHQIRRNDMKVNRNSSSSSQKVGEASSASI